jgi:hypothetical protein
MAKKKNKNITPIATVDELNNELDYDNFQYKEHFIHLCNLIPNNEKEKLEISPINESLFKNKGLVYVFVINGKIFKIGHTITSISERVQSYNCGKVEYRINGTNSTTNYFVLQSFLKINLEVLVYAFFPNQPTYDVFGKQYKDSYPPSKTAEKIILTSLTKKPIGCTQT